MSNLAVKRKPLSSYTSPLISAVFFAKRKVVYYPKPSALPLFRASTNGTTIHPNVQARNLEDILVTTLPHQFSIISEEIIPTNYFLNYLPKHILLSIFIFSSNLSNHHCSFGLMQQPPNQSLFFYSCISPTHYSYSILKQQV